MALKVAGVFVIVSDSGSGEVCFEPCLFHHLIFLRKKLPLPRQVLKFVFNTNILLGPKTRLTSITSRKVEKGVEF